MSIFIQENMRPCIKLSNEQFTDMLNCVIAVVTGGDTPNFNADYDGELECLALDIKEYLGESS